MPPFISLDLFSGIGGITKALEGIAKPAAFCEIDNNCHAILEARMADGSIPRAPIFSDVRKVSRRTLAKEGVKGIDMICGGWPCQDLSVMGKMRGLIHGARSGLIFEVIRLTDEVKPKMLFLENVPAILNNGIDVVVDEFVKKRGYEMRWGIVPACGVGAMHVRKRWFCLLVSSGFNKRVTWDLEGTYKPYVWNMRDLKRKNTPRGKVPLMVVPKSAAERKDLILRARILGNSVVPDAVRAAFVALASGFREAPDPRIKRLEFNMAPDPDKVRERPEGSKVIYKSWGSATFKDGRLRIFKAEKPALKQSPKLKIIVDPASYRGGRPPVGKVSRPVISRPIEYISFHTPRHESHASNALTERTIMDLPTMIRFERETPDEVRGGVIEPKFLEWLMGYKIGWTATKTLLTGTYRPGVAGPRDEL